MRKRSLKRRAAFILAVLMMFMNCFSSFASEVSEVEGSQENSENIDNEETVNTIYRDEDTDLDIDTGNEETEDPVSQGEDTGSDTGEVYEVDTDDPEVDSLIGQSMAVSRVGSNISGIRGTALLGAGSEDEDPVYGVWYPDEGIQWMISKNAVSTWLEISANVISYAPYPGEMRDYAPDSMSAWHKYFKNEFSSVVIHENVTRIGKYAFKDCTALETITISASVNDIRPGAFIGCSSITSFQCKDNSKYTTSLDDALYQINADGSLELLYMPFKGGTKLKIDPNTTIISDYACYNVSRLSGEAVIPASVREIGDLAFYGCSHITSYVLGDRTYSDTPSKVSISSNLTKIGSAAFGGNNNLLRIYMPDSLEQVEYDCFGGSSTLNGNDADLRKEDVDVDTMLEYIFYYSVHPEETKKEDIKEPSWTPLEVTPKAYSKLIPIPYNHNVLTFKTKIKPSTVESLAPITVQCGGSIKDTIYDLTKENKRYYRFKKWLFSDDDFDENKAIRRDYIPVVAIWDPMYDIIYDADSNLGGFIDNEGEYYYEERRLISTNKALPLNEWPDDPTPKDPEKEFLGWVVNNNSIITVDTKNPLVMKYSNRETKDTYKFKKFKSYPQDDDEEDPKTGYITLTALYKSYEKLTFYDSNEENRLEINYRTSETLSAGKIKQIDDFQKEDWKNNHNSDPSCKFIGWRSGKMGQGDSIDLKKVMTDDLKPQYYPYYKQYATIWLDYNDGSAPVSRNGVTYGIEEGKSYSIRDIPYRDGYVFRGWFPTKACTGQPYSSPVPGSVIKNGVTFYAGWQKLCTVSLNRRYEAIYSEEYLNKSANKHLKNIIVKKNITSGNMLLYDLEVPYDVSGNWKFAGWYRDKELKDETSIVKPDTPINEDMWLYAKWLEGCQVDFLIPIEETKGYAWYDGVVLSPGSTLSFLPEDPVPVEWGHRGYDFVGWFEEETNERPEDLVDKKTKLTKDYRFIAKFVPNGEPMEPMVTVRYDSMGGPEPSITEVSISINKTIPQPEMSTWTDHKFMGWYTDTSFTRQWDFEKDTLPDDIEEMTLYAKWITWTEEDEDNTHSIYWIRMLKGGKAPLTQYFRESGLKFSYDKKIVSVQKKGQAVKGKKVGETLITAYKVDGSEYPVKVRVFVLKQELQNMYAYNTSTILNAPDFLTVSGFLPDRWESSKTSVATIDPKTGIIKVRGRGKSKIKAYYQNKAVTATLYSEVPMFAKKFYIFKTGQSKKIKIKKVKKYDIVSWNIITTPQDDISQNKAGYAEVDNNGVVTAVSAGEVTLEAKVYGQTITTKIHIEPPTLKTRQLEIKINKTKKLKLSRTKLKYVEWKSSNDNVAYVDPTTGKVYALKTGRVTLRTTAGGVTNTCNVIVEDPEASKASSLSKTANSTLK